MQVSTALQLVAHFSQSASGLLCQRTHAHRAQGVHGVRHSSDEGWQPQEPSDVRIPALDDRAPGRTEVVDNHSHDDHNVSPQWDPFQMAMINGV